MIGIKALSYINISQLLFLSNLSYTLNAPVAFFIGIHPPSFEDAYATKFILSKSHGSLA